VDTSALVALLVRSDRWHAEAAHGFERLSADSAHLVTSSYVLVETYALLGRRAGLAAVRAVRDDIAPLLDVTWVDSPLHERGMELLLGHAQADLSLVDAVSLVLLRDMSIDCVYAFDPHLLGPGLPPAL
jgi:predicted nucleic acid-binding protein